MIKIAVDTIPGHDARCRDVSAMARDIAAWHICADVDLSMMHICTTYAHTHTHTSSSFSVHLVHKDVGQDLGT